MALQPYRVQLVDHLATVVEEFCSSVGLAQSTVLIRLSGTAYLIERYREGKGFSINSFEELLARFSACYQYASDNGATVKWPAAVYRPGPLFDERVERLTRTIYDRISRGNPHLQKGWPSDVPRPQPADARSA